MIHRALPPLVATAALFAFSIRETFSGALRYYSLDTGASFLWFLPDILALLCFLKFVFDFCIGKSQIFSIFVVAQVLISLTIGFFFLQNTTAAISSIKMIVPIFVGFSFAGRTFEDVPGLITFFRLLLYASILGVLVSSQVDFPWVGFTFDSFGVERAASRLWWSLGEKRIAGFASDNTVAGQQILTLFAIVSLRRGLIWFCLIGAVSCYCLYLTTSKTALAVLVLYGGLFLIVRLVPGRLALWQRIARWSFCCSTVPAVLIVVFSGFDLNEVSPLLYSLGERIENSWQLPFAYLYQVMPIAIIVGCGIGCFGYPQFYSDLADRNVPVDNFYLGNYLMFGFPFILFVLVAFWIGAKSKDLYKLVLLLVINVYSITVLGYGSSWVPVLFGYACADIFLNYGIRRQPRTMKSSIGVPATRPG